MSVLDAGVPVSAGSEAMDVRDNKLDDLDSKQSSLSNRHSPP